MSVDILESVYPDDTHIIRTEVLNGTELKYMVRLGLLRREQGKTLAELAVQFPEECVLLRKG